MRRSPGTPCRAVPAARSKFDPAVLSGRAAKGTVAGRLDVDAEMTNVSAGVAESVEGTVRMTLAPSTIGDLQIADVDADYRMRTAEFRKLEVVGRDGQRQRHRHACAERDRSIQPHAHADTPSLEEVGKIVGMPLTGIAKVDATITGNRTGTAGQRHPRGVGRDVPRQRRVVADDHLRARFPSSRSTAHRRREDRCDLRHRRRPERQRAHRDDEIRGPARRVRRRRPAARPDARMPPASWRCTPNTRKSIFSAWPSTRAGSGSSRPARRRRSATAVTRSSSSRRNSSAAINA